MAQRLIHRDIASAVIVSADDHVLLGQKAPGSGRAYADGSWLIPGGGMEPGETAFEAMQREIHEETGLHVDLNHARLVDDSDADSVQKTLKSGEVVTVNMRFLTFRVDLTKPAAKVGLRPSDELPVLRWVKLTELSQYPLPAPSVRLFTKLGYLA